jgi:hypothetical protein
MSIKGPALVFKKSDGIYATRHADREKGATVVKQFTSQKQLDNWFTRVEREVYPRMSSSPFLKLVRAMFGDAAVKRVGGHDRPALTREQVKTLTDPVAVARALRKTPGARLIDQDVAAETARTVKMAKMLLRNFDTFDARPTKTGVKRDQRVLSEDVQNLVVETVLFHPLRGH